MVTLKLVPTLSDADACGPGPVAADPFEQAVWAGAGRVAGPGRLTDTERAIAAARRAHPAGKARVRSGRRLAVVAAGESRLPRQRSIQPRAAGAAERRPAGAVQPGSAGGAQLRSAGGAESRSAGAGRPRAAGDAAVGGCRSAGRPADDRRRRARRAPGTTRAGSLRLTKRGRALVRSVVLLGVALVVAVLTVTSQADGDVRPVSSRSIVVAEHDTLWTIAERVAPERPRSETMNEIRELNDMGDAEVYTGQRLLIPASR